MSCAAAKADFASLRLILGCGYKVVWIDGSDAQRDALREEACATGEIIKLNQELLPDCYYHRTAENDVARVEDRTFICCENEEDALPHSIVKWKAPKDAYAMVNEIAKGAYKGRTMYVSLIRWAL